MNLWAGPSRMRCYCACKTGGPIQISIEAQMLAQAWALSLGVRLPEKDAVSRMRAGVHPIHLP